MKFSSSPDDTLGEVHYRWSPQPQTLTKHTHTLTHTLAVSQTHTDGHNHSSRRCREAHVCTRMRALTNLCVTQNRGGGATLLRTISKSSPSSPAGGRNPPKSDTNLCTFSIAHEKLRPETFLPGKWPCATAHHWERSSTPTALSENWRETVATSLVMVITLGTTWARTS